MREVALLGETLARSCASTAMVYAMHQIQVNCIVRHGRTPFFRDVLADAATHERLFASATTEAGVGGAVRQRLRGVEGRDDRLKYGAAAEQTITAHWHKQTIVDQVIPEGDIRTRECRWCVHSSSLAAPSSSAPTTSSRFPICSARCTRSRDRTVIIWR